jgi:hypothetical protein
VSAGKWQTQANSIEKPAEIAAKAAVGNSIDYQRFPYQLARLQSHSVFNLSQLRTLDHLFDDDPHERRQGFH